MPQAGGNGDGLPQQTETPVTSHEKRGDFTLRHLLRAARKEKAQTLEDVVATPEVARHSLCGDWLTPGAWLFTGRPKIGKGYFLLQLAAAVATGGKFLEWDCHKAEVLCLFAEDDNQRLKRRLEKMGIAHGVVIPAPPGVHIFNRQQLHDLARRYNPPREDTEEQPDVRPHLSLPAMLEIWLQDHAKVRMILADTETALRQIWTHGESRFSRASVNDVDYLEATGWDEFAMPHNMVLLLSNHPAKGRGKSKNQNPHESINRTYSAVGGSTGSIVLQDPHDRNPLDTRQKQRLLAITGRDMTGEISIGVHMDDQSCWVSDGPWYEVEQTKGEEDALYALLRWHEVNGFDRWASSKEIAELVNKKPGTLAKALSRMIAGNRTVWKEYRVLSKTGCGFQLETNVCRGG